MPVQRAAWAARAPTVGGSLGGRRQRRGRSRCKRRRRGRTRWPWTAVSSAAAATVGAVVGGVFIGGGQGRCGGRLWRPKQLGPGGKRRRAVARVAVVCGANGAGDGGGRISDGGGGGTGAGGRWRLTGRRRSLSVGAVSEVATEAAAGADWRGVGEGKTERMSAGEMLAVRGSDDDRRRRREGRRRLGRRTAAAGSAGGDGGDVGVGEGGRRQGP